MIIGLELWYVTAGWTRSPHAAPAATPTALVGNTKALGLVIYTHYAYFFEAAGLILLTAMIGAIVLTLRHKVGVKRQDISVQVGRTPATAVELRKVASRAGL